MDLAGCSLNKRLGRGRRRTTKGADLAVARRPFGASLRSRTNLQSWHACDQMRRVERPLQLAPPFAIRQFGAPKGLRCYCWSLAVAAAVARAVGAAVEVAVVGACWVARGAD